MLNQSANGEAKVLDISHLCELVRVPGQMMRDTKEMNERGSRQKARERPLMKSNRMRKQKPFFTSPFVCYHSI
jgi:hypothetical protein